MLPSQPWSSGPAVSVRYDFDLFTFVHRKCEPRLSPRAAEILANKYVSLRSQHRTRELDGTNAIPITVRYITSPSFPVPFVSLKLMLGHHPPSPQTPPSSILAFCGTSTFVDVDLIWLF